MQSGMLVSIIIAIQNKKNINSAIFPPLMRFDMVGHTHQKLSPIPLPR